MKIINDMEARKIFKRKINKSKEKNKKKKIQMLKCCVALEATPIRLLCESKFDKYT